jgi:preprotein translocase subunit SecG
MLPGWRLLQPRTLTGFAFFWAVAVLLFVVLIAIILSRHEDIISSGSQADAGAKEALGLLKDTTVWLAGIQTATLAALGLIAKDGVTTLMPTQLQIKLSILVALLNSSALFFSAWVLTALPSVTLRVYADPAGKYDFFNMSLYNSFPDPVGKVLSVRFFTTCNHWLWALGIILFGWLCISMAISRSQAHNQAPQRT